MRILYVTGSESSGGASIAAGRLLRALRAGGAHQVLHLTGRAEEPGTDAVEFTRPGSRGVAVQHLLALTPWADSRAWKNRRAARNRANLLRLAADFRPDVVHLHNINPFYGTGLTRMIAADLANLAPVVWTLHDEWTLGGCCCYRGECERPIGACGREMQTRPEGGSAHDEWRALSALGDRLVFAGPSRWITDEARAAFPANPARHVAYGLPEDWLGLADKHASRGALGLDPAARWVLVLADRLSVRRKGLHLLPDILAAAPAGMRLLVAGGHDRGLVWPRDAVVMGPLRDERLLRIVCAAADVLLLPSLEDNLPLVMLEAMARGTPVAGFRIGGVPDAVEPGFTGWLAESGDAAALGAALRDALALDGSARAAMSRRCIEKVRDEFPASRERSGYENIYESLRHS